MYLWRIHDGASVLAVDAVRKLSFYSLPVGGASVRQALTVSCSFVCKEVVSLAAARNGRKPSFLRLFVVPAFILRRIYLDVY